jgi:DNA-binding NtrC family response regulator
MDNGAYAFMNKPLDIDQLVTIMSQFKESGHDEPAMHDKQDG